MEDEETRKPPRGQYSLGADLEEQSVEALNALIDDLKAEIRRIEAAIAKKGSGRAAAESLFKK